MSHKQSPYYAAVLLWMVLIFLFSHQPAGTSDKQSGLFVSFLEPLAPAGDTDLLTFIIRKSAHFILYFILGVVLFFAIRTHGLPLKKTICISIIAVLGYATLDEIHQLFIPGRSGEVRDVLLDTTAGTLGIGLTALITRRFTRRRKVATYLKI